VEESHASPLRAMDIAYTRDSRRRHRYAFPHREETPMRASLLSPAKTPHIEDLVEMV